tara:strand:- start:2404 stop:3060 length:657 start_codon:yes stop_codon:yes gene_type:complete
MKIYNYNIKNYNFVTLFKQLFNQENLQNLHEDLEKEYDFFSAPGIDSNTKFHKIFYDRMRAGWPEFLELYKKIIKNVIARELNIDEEFIYQKWPSFRVHLPNNVAVGGWHKDADYNHPKGEINFIIPMTPMFESNATIAELTPGKMDFRQLEAIPGQIIQFNGNQCIHGNLPNKTGLTRVSFDFRILKKTDYNPNHSLESLSKGNKFLIGDYYEIMKI